MTLNPSMTVLHGEGQRCKVVLLLQGADLSVFPFPCVFLRMLAALTVDRSGPAEKIERHFVMTHLCASRHIKRNKHNSSRFFVVSRNAEWADSAFLTPIGRAPFWLGDDRSHIGITSSMCAMFPV